MPTLVHNSRFAVVPAKASRGQHTQCYKSSAQCARRQAELVRRCCGGGEGWGLNLGDEGVRTRAQSAVCCRQRQPNRLIARDTRVMRADWPPSAGFSAQARGRTIRWAQINICPCAFSSSSFQFLAQKRFGHCWSHTHRGYTLARVGTEATRLIAPRKCVQVRLVRISRVGLGENFCGELFPSATNRSNWKCELSTIRSQETESQVEFSKMNRY